MQIIIPPEAPETDISYTPLAGAFVVSSSRREGGRDTFMRFFRSHEPGKVQLMENVTNVNFLRSVNKHTLRGLRYQTPPFAQAKLVATMCGEAQDIIVDLRPHSHTFRENFSVVLRPQDDLLFIPKGFAHGYLSLTDNCERLYINDELYFPEYERGIRYDDPAFNLPWQTKPVAMMSKKDERWPDFLPNWHLDGMKDVPYIPNPRWR